MAAKKFVLHDYAKSRDRAEVDTSRVYFGLHDSSPSRDWAQHGAKVKVFVPERDSSPSRDSAELGILSAFSLHDYSRSFDMLVLPARPKSLVIFETHDSAPGRDTAFLSNVLTFSAYNPSPSRDTLSYVPDLPPIAVPVGDQQWGTVNWVRNPSLEDADFGITDWGEMEDGGPVELSRNGATAASGDYAALVNVHTSVDPAGRGASVRTQERLSVSTAAVGISFSFYTPDLDEIWWWAQVMYLDGTDYWSDGFFATNYDLLDQDDELVQSAWQRFGVNIYPDPLKSINWVQLFIVAPPSGDALFRVDAVQIEDASNGGVTLYTDGDQGENTRWLGLARRSMSVRDTA